MARYSAARIEEIREHLAELTHRKISVAQFAEEIGVSMWTVYTWKKRFGASGGSMSRRGAPPPADLIEIGRTPLTRLTSGIEIDAGDLTVRMPPGCDAGDLERVLRAVRSC
jgi:hypothetical protein